MKRLANELGAEYTIDPDRDANDGWRPEILRLGLGVPQLQEVFRNPDLVGDEADEFCAPPPPVNDDVLEELPCSAGHTACYISPYGDVFPCVQFPLPSGNVRRQKFLDIWHHSDQLNEVRDITARICQSAPPAATLASCSRCPGLAYLEGNMRGPSTQDCEKSFARTGIPSANMLLREGCGNARSGADCRIQPRISISSATSAHNSVGRFVCDSIYILSRVLGRRLTTQSCP